MPYARRITVDELRRRTNSGERFTFIDVRNPTAWAESDTIIPGAIRVAIKDWEKGLPRIPHDYPIVTYCT